MNTMSFYEFRSEQTGSQALEVTFSQKTKSITHKSVSTVY